MRAFLLVLILLALCPLAALAESVNYSLKRVAIHARLLENTLIESPPGGVVLEAVVKNLLEDIALWEESLAPRGGRDLVRSGLSRHRDSLLMSARSVELNVDQKASLNLLLSELERAGESIENDSPRETLGIAPELQPVRSDPWSRWGGFDGPWGPAYDPWGPYFGRPLNPGSYPWYW